jgi:predicted PurR-regulated permease PerM
MPINRFVEYAFFFVLLIATGYLVWIILSPFILALALALIIVTICYPLYEKIKLKVYKNNTSLAAGTTTLIVVFLIVLPLLFISSVFVKELVSFYQTLNVGQELTIDKYFTSFELTVQNYLPDFELNLTEQLKQSTGWFVGNIGAIFAGTVSTIFIILISLIGSFYFFRDGKEFLRILIKISPLPDRDDEIILSRLALAVRSVATGVLLVSLIQGTLAALGFTIFGIDRAVLWGAIGAILAMIPGVGTLVIMIPGIIYLFLTGSVGGAIGLLIWTIVTVVVIDNIIGPHLMSRGNNLHPFIVLVSVLGGISTFGPIGFIVGPVIVTLFIVLLEIYNHYLVNDKKISTKS